MALATERVDRYYEDIVAGTPIAVDIPVFEAEDVKVYYGNAGLLAVLNTDYTVVLDAPNFNTFTLTPLAALLTKINDLIAGDVTEINYIRVRRYMDHLNVATDGVVRDARFLTREFDRLSMRDLQLAEEIGRSLKLGPQFDASVPPRLDTREPGRALIFDALAENLIAGPTAAEIQAAEAHATAALNSETAAEAYAAAAEASAALAATFNPALFGALAEAEVVTGAWDFSGLIDFSDSVKLTGVNYLLFGASDQGKIRYNGSALVIAADEVSLQNNAGTETLLSASANGAVQLLHDNAQKLITSTAGITVTGAINADTIGGTWTATQAEAEAGASSTKVMTPQRTKQAIDALVPPMITSHVLLGTLNTTSGAAQTLSGLDLTLYKGLRLVFVGVSAGATGNITVGGSTVAVMSSGGQTWRGHVFVDLVNGTFSSTLADAGANWGAAAAPYAGDTTLTTASTSVSVAVSTGSFDAGTVLIYGEK